MSSTAFLGLRALRGLRGKAHLYGAGVRFEAFGARQRGDGGSELGERAPVELLGGDDLDVVGRGESSAQAGYAAGGENVIRSGSIIASGFGAEWPEEDAARVANLRDQFFVVETEVLRRESVRQFGGFVEVGDTHDRGVFIDRFARNRG